MFGICSQHDLGLNPKPDVWRLAKRLGASHISCSRRIANAEGAAANGFKVVFGTAAPAWATTSKPDWGYTFPSSYSSPSALVSSLGDYTMYQGYDSIYGFLIGSEILAAEYVNVYSPNSAQLNLINTVKAGIKHLQQQTGKPCSIPLTQSGAWDENTDYLERRRAWIRRFIDDVDFLDYHYYRMEMGGKGSWRDWGTFRAKLREMLQMLVDESQGKPIIIGECGCPSTPTLMWTGSTEQFTDQNQIDYFRIYGEEVKRLNRNILVFPFKLLEDDWQGAIKWAMFKSSVGSDGYSESKPIAPLLSSFIDVGASPPTPPPVEPPVIVPISRTLVAQALPYPLLLAKLWRLRTRFIREDIHRKVHPWI